jgi:hypothetical protein
MKAVDTVVLEERRDRIEARLNREKFPSQPMFGGSNVRSGMSASVQATGCGRIGLIQGHQELGSGLDRAAETAETAELVFENCRVPAENLLRAEDSGFGAAMRTLTLGRIMATAFAVSLATAAYEHALVYPRTRRAFGKRIGSFQGIAWVLADMHTSIKAAPLLKLQAAWRAARRELDGLEASRARLFATEACTRVTQRAL